MTSRVRDCRERDVTQESTEKPLTSATVPVLCRALTYLHTEAILPLNCLVRAVVPRRLPSLA